MMPECHFKHLKQLITNKKHQKMQKYDRKWITKRKLVDRRRAKTRRWMLSCSTMKVIQVLIWGLSIDIAACVCVCVCVCVICLLGHVWLFLTSWTVAYQAPLSMEFSGKNTGVDCCFLLQGISGPRDETRVSCISCIGRQILHHCATWEVINKF